MTDILNESTTDGSLESFIYTLRIGVQSGVFSDEIFKDIKRNLVGGVLGSLKGEIDSIPRPKRKQFLKYVSALIKPIESSTNMNSFINSLGIVADTKNNLIKNLNISEQIDEGKLKDGILFLQKRIKSTTDDTKKWWDENKKEIAKYVSRILGQILIEVLFVILRSLLKNPTIPTPKLSIQNIK
jgi:hypothetical protein